MSQASAPLQQDSRWDRLPERLRPRTVELPGSGDMRVIETTLLVLVGLVLTIATVNDVVRQRGVNERLIVDLRTWRHYTGHDYHNVSVDQELLGGGEASTGDNKDVACGNASPGPPKARTQICLVIHGPTRDGRRPVVGGWYLPPDVEIDGRAARYGCFGPAGRGSCRR
jgi:hypothetical protein